MALGGCIYALRLGRRRGRTGGAWATGGRQAATIARGGLCRVVNRGSSLCRSAHSSGTRWRRIGPYSAADAIAGVATERKQDVLRRPFVPWTRVAMPCRGGGGRPTSRGQAISRCRPTCRKSLCFVSQNPYPFAMGFFPKSPAIALVFRNHCCRNAEEPWCPKQKDAQDLSVACPGSSLRLLGRVACRSG